MSDIRTKPVTPEYEEAYDRLEKSGEFGKWKKDKKDEGNKTNTR